MKKFIINIFIFLLPFLIIGMLLEMSLRNIPNNYSLKKKYLDNHSDQIQTLLLGNSHVLYGLNPNYFDTKAFNTGNVSQSFNYDCEIFMKYAPKLSHLENVVISFSPLFLFWDLSKGVESWRNKNYVIYYDINITHSLDYSFELTSQNAKENLKRLYAFYKYGQTNITCSELGWGTNYNSQNALDLTTTADHEVAKHAAIFLHHESLMDNYKNNIKYLNVLFDYCQKHNIKVLMLYPPSHETYRKGIEAINLDQKEKLVTMCYNTVNEITSKYPCCKFIDLHRDPNFIDEDFYDSNHLSDKGAKKLSLMVNSILTNWN